MSADLRAQRLDELLARRREGRESREVRASALDRFVLRGGDSEYLGQAPSDAEIRGLVGADLSDCASPLRGEARVAQYVGPRDPDAVLSLVAGVSGEDARTPQTPPITYVVPSADRVLLAHQPAAQARVAILCPGPPHEPADDPVRRVFDEVLGGSANLFFQEIRESRGLAYSTGGSCDAGWRVGDADVMWAVTACDVIRAAEVAKLMLSLLPTRSRRASREPSRRASPETEPIAFARGVCQRRWKRGAREITWLIRAPPVETRGQR
jgi:predicted Zn-dependent peptidase